MQPADIRVEPWVWIPFSGRRRRILPTIIIAIAAASAGYILGRHSDKVDVAPSQKTVAVSSKPRPVAVTSKAKTADTGESPTWHSRVTTKRRSKYRPSRKRNPRRPLLSCSTRVPRIRKMCQLEAPLA
jgi:hypothetical protein